MDTDESSSPAATRRRSRALAALAFLVFAGVVAFGTFGPAPGDEIERTAGRVKEAGRQIEATTGVDAGDSDDWIGGMDAEEVANVAMFVPFGLLFPVALPRWRWLAVPAGVATSCLIELVQLTVLTHRSPTWIDIWWNSVGTALGFALYLALWVCSVKLRS